MLSKKRGLSVVVFMLMVTVMLVLSSNKTYSLKKGKKATFKVSVTPKKAKKSVAFKSSNKKVAAISEKGVVTAKKAGTDTRANADAGTNTNARAGTDTRTNRDNDRRS